MSRPGFPDRDEGGALFSYNTDAYAPPGPMPILFPPIVPPILEMRDRVVESAKRIAHKLPVPDFPFPNTTDKDDEDDCPAIALALRQIVVSIERLTETTRAGHTMNTAALVAIAEKMGHIEFILHQKLPHRNFTVGAWIDTQHHIRDGADTIAARLAQCFEVLTGLHVREVGFPELKHTSPKLDRDTIYLGDKIAWDTKQPPKP